MGQRQHDLLDLGTGPVRGSEVECAELVDAGDEKALPPVDHLVAQPEAKRMVLDQLGGAVDVGIEQGKPGKLRQALEIRIVELRPGYIAVGITAMGYAAAFQCVVVPALAPDEETEVVLADVDIADDVQGRGVGLVPVEVEVAVVVTAAGGAAIAHRNQVRVGISGTPTAAQRCTQGPADVCASVSGKTARARGIHQQPGDTEHRNTCATLARSFVTVSSSNCSCICFHVLEPLFVIGVSTDRLPCQVENRLRMPSCPNVSEPGSLPAADDRLGRSQNWAPPLAAISTAA
ncbi:hypothetical protein D9M69_398700 [compost metagenome]